MNRPLWFDVLSTAFFVKPQWNIQSIIIVPPLHIFGPSAVPGKRTISDMSILPVLLWKKFP